MRKINLFGCKDTSLFTAKWLIDAGFSIDLITLSSAAAERNQVAGYCDLTVYSDLFASTLVVDNYSLKAFETLNAVKNFCSHKVALCIGWQRLIPEEILNSFVGGVYGMHGSARDLPFGKGRSPLNWAIIEGRKHFTTNLFRYTAGTDDGPIVDSCTFSISSTDTAASLHKKNTLAMCSLVKKNYERMLGGTNLKQQNTLHGDSFYPKRRPDDGNIDWKDDIYNIERLVRAVTRPFHGASCLIGGNVTVIYSLSVYYTDLESHFYKYADYGTILGVFPDSSFLVRASGGVILVNDFEGYLPKKHEKFESSTPPLARFDRNAYGFFDL